MSGPYEATRQPGAGLLVRRTGSPLFECEKWDVHEATLNGIGITNNICEGWNSGFQHLVGHKNPGLWHVIRCLQKDQQAAVVDIDKMRRGLADDRRIKKTSLKLQKRLKTLCEDFNAGKLDLGAFLYAVGHCIKLQ